MDNFLTQTCVHKRPNGTGSLTTVQSNIACTPADPMGASPSTEYPLEVLMTMREFFTKYAAFQPGDYATFSSTDYPVRAAQEWGELGGLETFYRVLIEAKQGAS